MTTAESRRFDLHIELRRVLGESVADTLIEHLPPSGWADVARKSDLEWLQAVMHEKFEQVDAKFETVQSRFDYLDKRLNGIVAGFWAMFSVFTTAFIGLFTVLFTKF